MIFDWENKVIQVKIVYYGPAMSGKTTSLKYLFSYFGKLKELDSIESTVGRTLFFDFGVLQFKGSQWGLKFLLYSATGQDFYASTRPATLNGVDGIIFVADSQLEYLEHNLRSWNELKTLFGLEIYNLPLVIALNKCDVEYDKRLEKTKFMEYIEFEKYKFLSIINTIAINGKGIMDSFKEIIGFLFPQLTINMNPIT
ncbi:MAG: GTP-binding protein [Promethearchaeota archaeon]|jgi:GTPase SAR1 family protein